MHFGGRGTSVGKYLLTSFLNGPMQAIRFHNSFFFLRLSYRSGCQKMCFSYLCDSIPVTSVRNITSGEWKIHIEMATLQSQSNDKLYVPHECIFSLNLVICVDCPASNYTPELHNALTRRY